VTQASHLEALRLKHAELERQIEEEESRPMPDDALIHELKRKRLRIKDEMSLAT
jgi:hypothetical protein